MVTEDEDRDAAWGGHCKEVGTHTESPQHVPIAHSVPGGQEALLHRASPAQDVLPGTQSPPPSAMVTHTQSALVLHGTNVEHVAPAHPALGLVHTPALQIKPLAQQMLLQHSKPCSAQTAFAWHASLTQSMQGSQQVPWHNC